MARPFDFRKSVIEEVRARQNGCCACCGENLDDLWDDSGLSSHAHHVLPNQCGDVENPGHAWIRGADNCVILCDCCHRMVHAENTRTGAVAPPDYFQHAWAEDPASQFDWERRVTPKFWAT